MDIPNLQECRNCFVRGCSVEVKSSYIRYYLFPKEGYPNYLSTIKASGHTEYCILNAKPKKKFICSQHFTDDVNLLPVMSKTANPTLNLNRENPIYFSKTRCICDQTPPDLMPIWFVDCNSSSPLSEFTENIIAEGLRLGNELQMHFVNSDPDTERALKFQRTIKIALQEYEEVYNDIKKSKQTDLFAAIGTENFILDSDNVIMPRQEIKQESSEEE